MLEAGKMEKQQPKMGPWISEDDQLAAPPPERGRPSGSITVSLHTSGGLGICSHCSECLQAPGDEMRYLKLTCACYLLHLILSNAVLAILEHIEVLYTRIFPRLLDKEIIFKPATMYCTLGECSSISFIEEHLNLKPQFC